MQETVVEASAGGGTVTVKMDGRKQVLSLKIDPEAVKAGDLEMLQDLITAAVNEARATRSIRPCNPPWAACWAGWDFRDCSIWTLSNSGYIQTSPETRRRFITKLPDYRITKFPDYN